MCYRASTNSLSILKSQSNIFPCACRHSCSCMTKTLIADSWRLFGLQDAVQYLKNVNQNESLWLKHTRWKHEPFSAGFQKLLQTIFSVCTLCEGVARDDNTSFHKFEQRVPSPTLCCLKNIFSVSHQRFAHFHSQHMLSPSGVDAVFVISNDHDSSSTSVLLDQFAKVWNVTGVLLPSLFDSESREKDVASCLGMSSKAFNQRFRCASEQCWVQHILVAYLVVQNGLSNVLVVRGNATLLPGSLKARWSNVLQRVPEDYDVSAFGQCLGMGGVFCSGTYLISRSGAAKVLSGDFDSLQISEFTGPFSFP
mmetsp:Transcript_17836/g.44986  ORF Transcript_17836/g.44986 Transcript_17836/m.44986 type:complete len:309 (-) Transcript_17836:335-1261(-)